VPIAGKPVLPDELLVLQNVTVRLGVSSYPYKKLEDIIQRFSGETAIAEVRALIMQNFDVQLDKGQLEGETVLLAGTLSFGDIGDCILLNRSELLM
jgi:hypothetical protein